VGAFFGLAKFEARLRDVQPLRDNFANLRVAVMETNREVESLVKPNAPTPRHPATSCPPLTYPRRREYLLRQPFEEESGTPKICHSVV
jgi:hypothetical protein